MHNTAVALAAQVIMYDEPTAGLDPVASTVVEDLIRSLHVNKASCGSALCIQFKALQRHLPQPLCPHVAALLPCECTPPVLLAVCRRRCCRVPSAPGSKAPGRLLISVQVPEVC